MATKNWTNSKGLHDIGNGAYAYLLPSGPNGSTGWSNAGLICDGEESLLVDTLFDLPLTAEMLVSIKDATGIAGEEISTLINTHANGDHVNGNQLVKNAEIIASAASADELAHDDMTPRTMMAILEEAPNMGELGEFILDSLSDFDFSGIELVLPTRTFDDKLDIKVGDKDVRLINVGPAHTKGDTLVYVPGEKAIFTGDILFVESTPIVWAGPVSNWIKACDYMLNLDVDVVVPGHGPITDKSGVRQIRDYMTFIDQEARKRFDAGLSFVDAAHDIVLGEFDKLTDSERIIVNVYTLYKEYTGVEEEPDMMALLGLMAQYRTSERARQATACCDNPSHNH